MRAAIVSVMIASLSCAGSPQNPAPPKPEIKQEPTPPAAPKPSAPKPTAPKPVAEKGKKKVTTVKKDAVIKVNAPVLPAKQSAVTLVDQKLDDRLLQLVKAARGGGVTAADAMAKALSLYEKESLVKVEITAVDTAKVPVIKKAIETGKGELIIDLENHIFALVPSGLIETLAQSPAVYTIASTAATVRQ